MTRVTGRDGRGEDWQDAVQQDSSVQATVRK